MFTQEELTEQWLIGLRVWVLKDIQRKEEELNAPQEVDTSVVLRFPRLSG